MLLVDTNIFVYAADEDSPFHGKARVWLNGRRKKPDAWYTTWPILYEFMRVTTHARVMRRPWGGTEAWGFVASLLASPGLGILTSTERHAQIAAQVLGEYPFLSGNIFHDAHTAILMREHGIRQICTRDAHFHRFKFLEVVDIV